MTTHIVLDLLSLIWGFGERELYGFVTASFLNQKKCVLFTFSSTSNRLAEGALGVGDGPIR